MLVGDFLAYIDIFSVLLLLGVLSRVSTVPFLPSSTGKTPQPWGNPLRQKYSTLPNFGNIACVAVTRPMEEGRIAIVTTRAGLWGRGSHRREGLCRAGNCE
ncbi:hypothetical protein [Bradyrhizobium arachidis]|uniref:hypothetical protein n=1 Tax=Bradyrhizobium arachidis TaxID=858423 RepID=UPI002162292D|nr:hypothetical protein [Bradyrhizobium arachidis]